MLSEHKIHEFKEEQIHYAYVCVEVKINPGYTACTNTFIQTVYDHSIPDSWTMAALEGIIEATRRSVDNGLVENLVVRLISLNGMENETTPELIRCAAINAVWKILASKNEQLKIAYSNEAWIIEYPLLGLAS